MTKLPLPPAEPSPIHSTEGLAPKFRDKLTDLVLALTNLGWMPILRETLRTDERAAFLYGFGRTWDDGRGIVTNAPNGLTTWHRYGLAADVGDRRYEPGQEPGHFWADLERCAIALGLTSGAEWKFCDKPHVQWGAPMRASPSPEAAKLLAEGGVEAVWRAVDAA